MLGSFPVAQAVGLGEMLELVDVFLQVLLSNVESVVRQSHRQGNVDLVVRVVVDARGS